MIEVSKITDTSSNDRLDRLALTAAIMSQGRDYDVITGNKYPPTSEEDRRTVALIAHREVVDEQARRRATGQDKRKMFIVTVYEDRETEYYIGLYSTRDRAESAIRQLDPYYLRDAKAVVEECEVDPDRPINCAKREL